MKKVFALLLAGVLAFSTLIGCAGGEPSDSVGENSEIGTESAGETSDEGDVFKVAWLHNASDQWHHQCALIGKQRMEEAFDNVEVTLYDNKGEVANIQPFLEQLAMEGDWDLCIYGTVSDDSDYIRQLHETGCNVICYSIRIDALEGVCSTFVCSEYDLGYQSAMRAAELLPENANIVVLRGTEGYSGTILRGQGFEAAFAEREDVTILGEKFCKFSKADAMTTMEDWITQYGDTIDGVICENDAMALGAIEALNAAGIDAASLVISGVDGLYEGCVAIQEGVLDVSSYQSADAYADAFIERIRQLQSGEVDPTCADDYEFEPSIVDATNVDEMIARYEALGMAQ